MSKSHLMNYSMKYIWMNSIQRHLLKKGFTLRPEIAIITVDTSKQPYVESG